MSASGEDPESIQEEINVLWAVLEASLAVMDELQKAYLRLGDNVNQTSVEAEGWEKKMDNVTEKAVWKTSGEGYFRKKYKRMQT